MKKLAMLAIVLSGLLPTITFAFQRSIKGFAAYFVEIISDFLIPFLVTLALTWFIWGVVSFIRAAENPEERKRGKQKIIWGIIALFFMIAFIGISSVFTTTLFNKGPILPQLYTND